MPPSLAARLAERERPPGRPVMFQRWTDLLFLHWEWDPSTIQRTLPPGLRVDTFDGKAWLGIVPFFMRGVRPAMCPPVPGVSNFLELNVRTYVFDSQGRPGVWFYSLDANQWLAVKLARSWFHLPYQHAAMSVHQEGGVDYRVRRRGGDAASRFCYGPAGLKESEAEIESLEFFLVERYRLFSHNGRSRLYSGRVAHAPYKILAPEVTAWDDLPLRWNSFESPDRPPDHVCYSPGVSVRVFPLEPVEAAMRAPARLVQQRAHLGLGA